MFLHFQKFYYVFVAKYFIYDSCTPHFGVSASRREIGLNLLGLVGLSTQKVCQKLSELRKERFKVPWLVLKTFA